MSEYRIKHITRYTYPSTVIDSANQVMLFPLDDEQQEVKKHDLIITHQPSVEIFTDYFGNKVGIFSIIRPHHQLTIESIIEVVTQETQLPDSNIAPPAGIAAVLGGSISCFNGPAIEANSGSLWTRVAFKRSAAATTNESAKETLCCATLTSAALAQSALVRVLPGGGQALQVGDSFSRGFFTKIVERDVLLIRQCDSACL